MSQEKNPFQNHIGPSVGDGNSMILSEFSLEVYSDEDQLEAKISIQNDSQQELDQIGRSSSRSPQRLNSMFSRRNSVDTFRADYNKYQTPPNFERAKIHARAFRVSNLPEDDEENPDNWKCPWCHYPLDADVFNICETTPKDLGQLGCGFTLYYDLIKCLIWIMLFCFAISFFALYDNYTAGKEGEWDESLKGHWIVSGTIAAHGTESHPSIYQPWLNAVMSWTCLFIYVITHIRSKDIVHSLQMDDISPADFTLLIRNIPINATKADIWTWIEENGTPADMDSVKIHNITLVHDSRKFRQYENAYNQWRTYYENAPPESTLLQSSRRRCEQKMAQYHKLLKEIEEQADDGEIEFTGYAFVTFEFEKDAKIALSTIRTPKTLHVVWTKLRHLLCFYRPRSRNPLLGKNVIVQRPEQPQDIVWENFGGKESQFKIRLTTGWATFGILAICFCIVLASAQWKKFLTEQQSGDEESEDSKNELRVLTLIPAIVINFVNICLTVSIRYFTKFEKFDTVTDYNSALTIKMTTAMFLSTAMIVNVVYREAWYDGEASLIVEISSIIFITAIIHPFITFFDAFYLKRKIRQWLEKRKGEDSKLTQQEANELFQGPQIDLAVRSAYYIKSYLLTMTYGAIMPVAFPIAAISFFIEYWVDKYILLRRNCRPPIIGKNLVNTISRFIPIGVFLNCLFSMIFHYNYNSETLVATLTGLVFSFVFLLTPWERVLKLRKILRSANIVHSLRSTQNIQYEASYDDYRHLFMKDYDRMNPISARRAIQDWLLDIRKKRESESISQAMVQAYGTSRKIKRQIFDVFDGEPATPTWIDVRRIQGSSGSTAITRASTFTGDQYEPNVNDALVRAQVRRRTANDGNILS